MAVLSVPTLLHDDRDRKDEKVYYFIEWYPLNNVATVCSALFWGFFLLISVSFMIFGIQEIGGEGGGISYILKQVK